MKPRLATPADLKRLLKGKRKSKYGNVRVKASGYSFDSKAESRRWLVLKGRQDVGIIRKLVVHPKYDLGSGITYIGDFSYEINCRLNVDRGEYEWESVTEDVKGVLTAVFRLKAKLFKAKYGREIVLITGKP